MSFVALAGPLCGTAYEAVECRGMHPPGLTSQPEELCNNRLRGVFGSLDLIELSILTLLLFAIDRVSRTHRANGFARNVTELMQAMPVCTTLALSVQQRPTQ